MKIRNFINSKAHMMLTVLFFLGIVLSVYELYLLPHHLTAEAVRQACGIVFATFFAGLVAVNFMALSRKQTVVYLEKKREHHAIEQDVDRHAQSKLDTQELKKIIEAQEEVPQRILSELCHQLQAGQGAIYTAKNQSFELNYGYALSQEKDSRVAYASGEGLVGRVAAEGRPLYIDQLPEGYITVYSGLGCASPTHLVIVPLKKEDEVKGVLEIATFAPLNERTRRDLENTGVTLAEVIR